MAESYDLAILGAGSTGLTAAGFAAQLGVRVALVERDRIGGECTWTGCVPSKSLIRAARIAHQMRIADRYGLTPVEPQVDLGAVMAQVRDVIAGVYREESPETLRARGIDVFLAAARFAGPHTLVVDGTTLTARHVLVATGAELVLPPVPGLDQVDCLTYENLWDLTVLPSHLLAVGAGPLGCEIAQALRRLGADVTLLASGDRLLPRDDPDASRAIGRVFEAEGIHLRYDARAERAWQDETGIHLAAGDAELVGDALFVATGRRPHVEGLGLEQAGVTYSAEGIQVDDRLRTSQNHIYAAGDCIGRHQFSHYAGWQAVIAVRNALLPGSARGIPRRVPWATFTDPEVAHVGLNEAQARATFGDQVETHTLSMEQVDRARTDRDTEGFIKLVHRKGGELLGATIVAGQAGEMIHEWITALDNGLKVDDVAEAIHVYPTYSTGNWQVAADIRVERLLDGASGRLIRALTRLTR